MNRVFWCFLSFFSIASVSLAQPISTQSWQAATISSGTITITCADLQTPYDKGSALTCPNIFTNRTTCEPDRMVRSPHPVRLRIQPESGTTDTLTNITGCTTDGATVQIRVEDSGDIITVQHTTSQIEFANSSDFVMNSNNIILSLVRDAGAWRVTGKGNFNSSPSDSVSLTLADTTPLINQHVDHYTCDDTTVYTDFVDSDGDHSEFGSDFQFSLKATSTCGIDCSSANISCNAGVSWTAAVGDLAICSFSVDNNLWTCILSNPTANNSMSEESSSIIAPTSASIDWIRMSGDPNAPAFGSNGTIMYLDIDNDQVADCSFSKSGGNTEINCLNTNTVLSPGQSGGDLIFNDFGGTACMTIDPDNGTITQGTNCSSLSFDGSISSLIVHDDDTLATVVLSGADCRGAIHKNTDADAIDYTLCDGETGGGQLVCFEDRAGGAITVDVNDGSEVITLANGTALDAGDSVTLASGIGNRFCIMSDSSTAWHVIDGVGTVSDGGP